MTKVYFSIDKWWDMHTLKMFTKRCDELRALGKIDEVKPMVGSFEGEVEISFCCGIEDYWHLTEFTSEQACVLMVDSTGEAYMHYGCRDIAVGFMKPTYVKPEGDFTYDPSTRLYYKLEENK